MAVDVVLLPDGDIVAKALTVNRRLVEQYDRHIVLDESHLPHISLAMGCIETDDIAPAAEVLETVAQECPPGDLVITGIATTLNARGRQVSSFILAQTGPLQTLHERIMNEMQAYFSYDVTPEMIYGEQNVAETTLAWIRTYREKAAFRAFFPHITLGYGMVSEPLTFPMACVPSTLALCQLGNHCTCRRVLTHVEIRNQSQGPESQ